MVMDRDVPFLPPEIVTNILKCLPVKSLIRFQCVCKNWKNLLKDPSFIVEHFHFHRSRNENSLLLLQWDAKCDPLHLHKLNRKMQVLEFQRTPLMDYLSRVTIVGCSNGLLCVKTDGDDNSPPSLIVWNPATREVRQVPSPINLYDDGKFFALGFGFSPIVNDYKILISHDEFEIGYEDVPLEVYSLSTGSWKEIIVQDFGEMGLDTYPVTVNGAIFWYGSWLSSDSDDDDDDISDWMIVSFDIAREVFTLIPLPFDFTSCVDCYLTEYENKLATLSRNVNGSRE